MRWDVRAIIISALSSALYVLADGIKCAVSGMYFGRVVSASEAMQSDTALMWTGSDKVVSYVDYGAWAAYLSDYGVDVHTFWPFFIVLAVVGVFGLWRFLCAELVGWALLVAFGVATALRGGWFALVPGTMLVVLFLPSTLRLLFAYRDKPVPAPAPPTGG